MQNGKKLLVLLIIGAIFFVGCANKAEEVNVNESVNSTTGLKLNLTWGLAESIIPESIGEYKLESIALYDKNSGESFFFKNKNCTMLKRENLKKNFAIVRLKTGVLQEFTLDMLSRIRKGLWGQCRNNF